MGPSSGPGPVWLGCAWAFPDPRWGLGYLAMSDERRSSEETSQRSEPGSPHQRPDWISTVLGKHPAVGCKTRGNPRHPEPPAANLRTGPRRCRRCLGISGVRRPGWPSVLAPTGGSPDESGDVSDGPGMSPHPPGKLLRTPRGGRFESGLSWANRVKTTRTRTGIATAYSLSQRIQPTPSRYSDQPENPPSGDR